MALVEALSAVAARTPERPALAWRGSTWTYRDLCRAISGVDRALRGRGLEAGARVALLMRNSPHYVASYYGVLASGGVAVPLNVQERAPVLQRHVENCGASLLIGDSGHAEWGRLEAAARARSCGTIGLRLDAESSSTQLAANYGVDLPVDRPDMPRQADDDALASIIYTSGTTGSAKGVMLSHRNLESNARAIIGSLGLTASDHSLCVLPFFFSYGNSILHSHLLCGARLTLEDNAAFSQVLLQRLQDERASGFAGVPSTFALLLSRHRLDHFDLGALRYITQAGGPMPRPLVEEIKRELPHVDVFLMYGQTEAAARITCLPPGKLDTKVGSVGLPIEGVEVQVRVEHTLARAGQVGEIFVRGPNVMLGYWNDPAGTAEVLRDGWLRTRDVGYLDEEGYLFLVGRSSDMIKVGAFRIGPQEIEEAIAGLEGVEEVGVVGVEDDLLGQIVKAVIVCRPGTTLNAMSVKAYCRQKLASYKIPKIVEFAAELPRTSSGKVQRHKLVESNST